MSEYELKNSYKVRGIALKTLRDRGYKIPEGSDNLSFEDYLFLYKQNRHHPYFPKVEPLHLKEEYKKGGGILIYFEESDKFDKTILQNRLTLINKEYPNLDKLFFVLKTYGIEKKQKLNSFVRTELHNLPNVEVLEDIYPFDFMKSSMIPECFLLSSEEKEAILNIMDTTSDKFPKFENDDPIVKRLGAKIGDIVHIKRYGGSELSYRVVVKSGTG